MPLEPLIRRDPDHRGRICGAIGELVSKTLTSCNDRKHQVEVTPQRRRCADLNCAGHALVGIGMGLQGV